MFEFGGAFGQITGVLLLAALFGAIGFKLRQPLIVSFIAVGILVGPAALGLVRGHEHVELLAEIGISLLLFIVGLRLDVHMIRTMGPVALATGLGQVAFTSIFGFLIGLVMGMGVVEALYVAVALTFSSTIIIVKLLSDKKEINALHGRIAVGFLIVQDLVVVLAMIALSALGARGEANELLVSKMLWVVGKGLLLLAGVIILMRYVLPRFVRHLARSQELLVLFAVAWAVFMAALGDRLGFSKEVGAFLAGIALASTPFRDALGSRLVTLRDFLLLFFFIDLGSRLDLSLLGSQLGRALVFSMFVLVGNPLIVMTIMGAMGYRKRTGFLAGLTVAQISEFSLILAALGLTLEHIGDETMGLITLVGLVTIGLSTYMILYSDALYRLISPFLSPFERRTPFREMQDDASRIAAETDVILFGLGTYGSSIARSLLQRGKRVVGVDFDPEVLESWHSQALPVLYGDASDPELFEHLPLGQARWVVSALPDRHANDVLLHVLKSSGFRGRIVMTGRDPDDADYYRRRGADRVFCPLADAAEQAVDSLTAAMHVLSDRVFWPTTLLQVRLEAGSVFSGHSIGQIPLRPETGVSILAVSRAGKTYYNPAPDFRLFPGDWLVLLGAPENLERARDYLGRREVGPDEHLVQGEFQIAPLDIASHSPWIGRTLADLNLRAGYGVTVIGIQRGSEQITAPTSRDAVLEGDRLMIAGRRGDIEGLLERHGRSKTDPEER